MIQYKWEWHPINASPTYWLSGFRSAYLNSDRRGTGDFLLFPFRKTVRNVISTIVVYRIFTHPLYQCVGWLYSSWLFWISVDVFRQKVNFSSDKMLTDMTPTAGQFYGAQIPAMTMNVKPVVSITTISIVS